MDLQCSVCGAQAEQGARFCHECGTSLVSFCAPCGAILEPDAWFCGECGAQVNRSLAQTPPSLSENANRPEQGKALLRAFDPIQAPSLVEQLQVTLKSASPESLPVVIGRGLNGEWVADNLVAMRHLAVLGTPCSGKSSLIIAMLLDMLSRAGAEGLQLLIIDDKGLDFQPFDNSAPLLTPVISDSRLASLAIAWCQSELAKRLRLCRATGCRGIHDYNNHIHEAKRQGHAIVNPFSISPDSHEGLEALTHIVIVIDDIRVLSGEEVSENNMTAFMAILIRGAQVGLHLIAASTNYGDGLIKEMLGTGCAKVGLTPSYIPDMQKVFGNHPQTSKGELGQLIYCHVHT